MKELQLVFESTMPEITHNFDECKAILAEGLESYKSVQVTTDNLPESKKLVTELNKSAKFLEDRRKAVKKEILKPYEELEPKVKELVGMINDASASIKEQCDVFENERKETCKMLLEAHRDVLYSDYQIEEDYQHADITPIIGLTALTGKDALTKTAMEKVEALVMADKARQDKHSARIMQVENMCLKAGVEPLTKASFSHSLDEQSDDVFTYKIQAMIDSELERQKAIEERARLKAEQEMQAKAETVKEEPKEHPKEEPKPVQPSAKDREYHVTIKTIVVSDNPVGLADRIRKAFNLDKDAEIIITG